MQFTDQNFKQEVEESNKLVFVDFFAPWCGPCKLLGPIVEELCEDYKNNENVKIGKLNTEENQETTEKYGIMGIPAIILFKDGKIVEQTTGLQSKQALKDLIDKNL